ncbi:MAG: exodeoxyribonuclease III [Bacilli bacterium]|jgi:exodeoxyribonuclease-3|nr:exodeoxyribonuclease III [Bacilli bacterium]
MILMSFNMNSIRAYLGKNLTSQWTGLAPDVLGIEELKLTETEHKDFPFTPNGYTPYWTVSKVKKGYAGTAVLTKGTPLSVHYGLEDGLYDDEGRVITLEFKNFYFVEMYVPNSGENPDKDSKPKRLPYRLEFEANLRKYLSKLQEKKPIIVTGDLNVSHEEIDLKHPETNHLSAGFTDEERDAFGKLLDIGLVDTFRSLHPAEAKYSYWSYRFHARENNAGWRLDYFLVSKSLMAKVRKSEILNDVFGSDHCPVLLDIDLDF